MITSAKDTKGLSIGFDRNRDRRKQESTNNKNIIGIYHLRIILRDVFGFAEHQEKANYGLGYKLTLTRNKDEVVIDKAVGTADVRMKIDHIHWYVRHYTPSFQQQSFLSNEIYKKIPKELRYNE